MEWEREIHTRHKRTAWMYDRGGLKCAIIYLSFVGRMSFVLVSSYPFNIISNNTAATDINCTTLWYYYYHHHHNHMGVYKYRLICLKQLEKNGKRVSKPNSVGFYFLVTVRIVSVRNMLCVFEKSKDTNKYLTIIQSHNLFLSRPPLNWCRIIVYVSVLRTLLSLKHEGISNKY